MRACVAQPLERGADTVAVIPDRATAAALKDEGIVFLYRYLGSLTVGELGVLLAGGLEVGLVTFAEHFDGRSAVVQLRALGIPQGVTVFLDLEGTGNLDAPTIIAKVNAWAATVSAAGFEAGLYVGSDSKLTSAELSALLVVRYWHSCSRVVDRNGVVAEPSRGWCLIQGRPNDVTVAGVDVDVDFCQADYRDDVPTFVAA